MHPPITKHSKYTITSSLTTHYYTTSGALSTSYPQAIVHKWCRGPRGLHASERGGGRESVILERGGNRYPLGLGWVGVWFESYSCTRDPSPPGRMNPTVRSESLF
jgi:hypothetical protein